MLPSAVDDPGPTAPAPRSDIAFFVRALEGGGAQRDAILLANALAERGRRIAIITLRPEGHLRDSVADTVALVTAPGQHLRAALPGLRRAIRDLSPRVLVSAEAAPNTLAVLATRTLPAGSRPRLVLREAASPSIARAHDPYRQNRLAYRLLRWIYPRADAVVTLTQGARRDLIENFGVPDRLVRVLESNAVVDDDLLARPDRPREPGLVVALGRLSPEKDFPTLIEAAARLTDQAGLSFAIAGEGEERGRLEALIRARGLAGRVRLLGRVEPFELLSRASLAVCSSRYEGFGNAIVEALACGTPVVATDCPYGPAEILAQGRFGRLVPVGDPAALARAIVQSLAEAPDRALLRECARHHTLPRAAEAFLRIADSL